MAKFFELIKADHNFEFVGRQRLFFGLSAFLIIATVAMLPINHYWRGAALNFSTELRGGTEMTVEFSKPAESGAIRDGMSAGGFHDTEVVPFKDDAHPNSYILRFGAVSAVNSDGATKLEQALREKVGAEVLRKFEFSEGGDKFYARFSKPITVDDMGGVLKAQGISYSTINTFGRIEDNQLEVVLVGLNLEVTKALNTKLGEGAVKAILSSDSVGAKAGKELRDNGITTVLAAILFIMLYILVRFDFRYGPGTVLALLHDAFIVVGAFAITYKEFSLTTVAAILTVIGYSMNDTIVVFDRIRENVTKYRDKRFDRIVNASINETLSRTILTAATVFFVTLAMNIWGTGTIREFAFAMNVGVIVGTYSSIFIAAPILIWLNERFFKPQGNTKPSRAS
ncbi:MAG: protein translocase subunit SecF [Myxococcales bacterium]|nr:protein translocase subunit SecF [Myxococcales bacterium]